MAVDSPITTTTVSFPEAGRENLTHVLKALKKALHRRPTLRTHKIVFFTSYGEGPLQATGLFREHQPEMIAVTFPRTLTRGENKLPHEIPSSVKRYLDAFGITVIAARLPFEPMDGARNHNAEMELINKALSIVSSSMPLCVQAILQACDHGHVLEGELVIGVTGDMAALVSACSTQKFLGKESPFFVKEFLCKPLTPIRRSGGERPPSLSSETSIDHHSELATSLTIESK